MVRHLLRLLMIGLLTGAAFAQIPGTGKVTARLAQSRIGADQTTTLTVSVSGLSGDVRLSDPTSRNGGLQFNHIGQRFSMTSVNGVSKTATEYDYEVVPTKKGRHIIEPITGTVSGLSFSTESLRLEVTAPQARTSNPYTGYNPYTRGRRGRGRGFPRTPMFDRPRERADDVLLEGTLLPDTVYKHQPTIYNLKFLTAVNLYSDPRYVPVSPTGFLMVPFPQDRNQRAKEEYRNNRRYAINEINTAFYPLTVGDYDFPATQVRVQTGAFAAPKTISTGKKTLKVLPLPSEGRPRSFTGAVGEEFQIKNVFLSENKVVAGQTVELTITVAGDGHLELVPYPHVPEWDGMDRKQSASPSTTEVKRDKVVSTRTYNFRLKPTKAGTYDLSDIAFAFFRPSQKRYEVVKGPALTLEVAPGGEALRTGGSQLADDLPEQDRPIIDPGVSGKVPPHLEPPLFLMAGGLLLLGILLNLGSVRGLAGPKLFSGSSRRYESVGDVLAHIAEIAPGPDTLSRQRELLSRGWSDDQLARLESLRNQASKALYGPSPDSALGSLGSELGRLLKEVKKR